MSGLSGNFQALPAGDILLGARRGLMVIYYWMGMFAVSNGVEAGVYPFLRFARVEGAEYHVAARTVPCPQ